MKAKPSLGHPSEFVKMPLEELRKRHYLFVAGGVGTAPVYPQVKWLREHGVKADVIIGAKNKQMLIYTDAMRAVTENLYIATDDGSEGFKGLVTQVVEELVEKQGRHYDECVAIGPMIMMKFVALTTKKYGLKTTVSLNALMVDGTGMCGACRVTVGGRTRFTCVDGPEFDAHEVVRACTAPRNSVPQPSRPNAKQDIRVKSDWTSKKMGTPLRFAPSCKSAGRITAPWAVLQV